MRFAPLESVRQGAATAARRFPLPLACAWATCAILDALIVVAGDHRGWLGLALMLSLGIPVCFALACWNERLPGRLPFTRWVVPIAAIAMLAAIAWAWPHWTGAIQARRYAQLSLLAHALVAFLPYLAVREPNGFWQYNRTLLERFVLSTIFAGVLTLGLQGALASLKPLFGLDVSGKAYALIATWAFFVFHPWFFLAGMPEPLASLEARRDYPAIVRVFAQFILVPLVAVYQALLGAYLLKVVVTGKWPSGTIGWLVSAEAIGGMLAILLIHPVRERAENLWVRTFARGFHLALVPSIVMLGFAIGKRVAQYGVTEDRYFVIALTVWLAAISVYFIVRRDGDIRWIPVTLALLAVVTFGGPWGAYRVSLASQRARLVHLLEANGMWRDGRAARASGELSYAARRELSASLAYLLDAHGGSAVRDLLGGSLTGADSMVTDPEHARGFTLAQHVATRLNFAFVNSWEAVNDSNGVVTWSRSSGGPAQATPLAGFAYHVPVDAVGVPFHAGARTLILWFDNARHRLVLADTHGPYDLPAARARIDTLASGSLDSLIAQIHVLATGATGRPQIALAGPGARGKVVANYVYVNVGREFHMTTLTGDLYFSLADSTVAGVAAAAGAGTGS